MRNQLWNEHGREGESTRSLYQVFFDSFSDQNFLHFGNKWQGIKLISDQYIVARAEFQAIQDPNDLAGWMMKNQHRFFNIPMIHAFNQTQSQRKPSNFLGFEICSIGLAEIDTKFYHHQSFEEPVNGRGYEGDLRVYIPYSPARYDDISVREALASFGIYTYDMVYENDDSGRFLDARFYMLQRDFQFKIDWTVWAPAVKRSIKRLELDDDDDDEPDLGSMTPLERDRYLAKLRAEEIEDGFDPEELDID